MKPPEVILTLAAVASAAQLGCASDDGAAATGTRLAAEGRVSSSIAEGAQLSEPLRWTARVSGVPPGQVALVRFLIDGKLAHVERKAPYRFAGRGNLLVPGALGRGSHTLVVDARLRGGHRLTAASTATVSGRAGRVPAELVRHWTRTVSPAQVRRTETSRRPEDGEPLPVGTWKVWIGADAIARYVDPTSTHDLTVGQVRFRRGGRLVVGNEVPNVSSAGGYFCPDTVGTGEYRWSLDGNTLLVRAVHDPECADRNSFWTGKFTTKRKEP